MNMFFQIYKDFIEDAEHGVILFSLGYTGFSASDIPKNVILALLESFASIDQRVIMRFDKDVLPYIPNNVMVSNWVPQVAILGKLVLPFQVLFLKIFEKLFSSSEYSGLFLALRNLKCHGIHILRCSDDRSRHICRPSR